VPAFGHLAAGRPVAVTDIVTRQVELL
jgi:hypothetical protein